MHDYTAEASLLALLENVSMEKNLEINYFARSKYKTVVHDGYRKLDLDSLMRRARGWAFRMGFSSFSLLTMAFTCLVCSFESDSGIQIYPVYFRSFDVILGFLCILTSVVRLASCGLRSLNRLKNFLELISGLACLLDVSEILIFGHTQRSLTLRVIVLLVLTRLLTALPHLVPFKGGAAIMGRFNRALFGTSAILFYKAIYMPIVSLFSALLVVPAVLPHIYSLQARSGPGWVDVKSLFGSLSNGVYSMFEISTLDDWASRFARPLNDAGFWLPNSAIFAVVIASNLAFMSVAIGFMVDRAIEISHELNERKRMVNEEENDINRRALFFAIGEVISRDPGNSSDKIDSAESFIEIAEQSPNLRALLHALELDANDILQAYRTIETGVSEGVSLAALERALARLKIDARGQDLIHITSLLNRLQSRTVTISRIAKSALSAATSSENRFNSFKEFLCDLSSTRKASVERNQIERIRMRHRNELIRALGSRESYPS